MPLSPENNKQSLWADTSPKLPLPTLKQNLKADICIIGAGITGLTTAYLLAKAGKKVVVIDRDSLGGGDTGWTTAHITNVLDKRFYELEKLHGEDGARVALQSQQEAIDKIESIVREEKIDCDFSRVDGYLFLAPHDDREPLERELQELKKLGQQNAEMARHNIQGIDLGISLKFPRQAQFHPLKYLNALAKSIQAHGGEIYEKSFAEDIQENPQGVQVRLKNNLQIDCHAALVATNSPFNDRFEIHTKQAAYQTYVLALKIPQNTVAPALCWDTGEPYHYIRTYSSADLDHDLLIVGGEDHRTGQGENTEKHFQKLAAWTKQKFPQAGEVLYQWSGQVLEPIDGLAYIGLNPGDKRIYIATGYSGNGMTSGTIAAIINSDLILGKDNHWAKLYRPDRKNLRAFSKFFLGMVNIFKQIFGSLFQPSGEINKLKNDAGTVITSGLKKTAVYKDSSGKLSKYSAVCPHMGCIVGWNGAEKTWDCPCHGSRFDAHGKVIKGPANTDLPKDQE